MFDHPTLTQLRRTLHQNPELSHQEQQTAQRIRTLFESFQPDEVHTQLGGHGLAFVFDGEKEGPSTLIRCELDALPIQEQNHFAHRSLVDGVSHKCGHDGHMAIISSLGATLAKHKPKSGRVILCFQPAEETGSGAIDMVKDEKFSSLTPNYAFALHNYPGLELGKVAVRAGTFNCASRGIIIKLTGKTSHAAHPEDGVSPALTMCKIIETLNQLPQQMAKQGVGDKLWVTVIHAKLGEVAFGTAPGDAVIMATLRSETNQAMDSLIEMAQTLSTQYAKQAGLEIEFSFDDVFQASVNSQEGCDRVVQACLNTSTDYLLMDEPMRWSEDFGQFTAIASHGAMFALGAGVETPQLHNPDYDFADELIPIGHALFVDLIQQINGLA
ncbi:amidohydrolase [Vibrio sinaloensis]|uniref:amidohydrolase n=1 Tax=Photobacterium sp. (strain ATCC 43367) TaxID=379097 RepID=UPI0022AF094D|nr:amidohydrolase [Vibrio sinaloensis]MCZ4295378.1 amidohydrolase [Vibrio sinaloensis]